MDKYYELKTEYEELFDFIKELVPDAQKEAFSLYFIAAVLKIWGSNYLYSPDYSDLLSAITDERYTIEQVVTAMRCCGDPERVLLIPAFFTQLVKKDLQSGNKYAAEFVTRANDLFVGAAMINGDFTIEEAICLSSIIDGLVNKASSEGLSVADIPDNTTRITEKNDSSYLQNETLLSAARQAKIQKPAETAKQLSAGTARPASDEPAEPVSDENTIPVTITINLVTDEGSAAIMPDTQAAQPEEAPIVTAPSVEEPETIESLLAELDGLVGLKNVKQDVHSLMNFIKVTKIREQRGMKIPTISYHLVFTGNPGTGKTTVARLVAKLYYQMGLLPQGQLVETDRSALVAGYLGQTAIKTQKVIQQAMGGVLFIDEAYSLAGETDDSYGREAIETILKAMEDHRDEFVVIVAGYTELMHKFIDSNPGLSSRFSKYFEFPDYTGDDLLAIFDRLCEKNGYALDPSAEEILKNKFVSLYENRDDHFGNARTARNIFEKAINAQADRIAAQSSFSDEDLVNISSADIAAAIRGVS